MKSLRRRGQAWIVFEKSTAATKALESLQGFPLYNKPMRIAYARSKSDVIAKKDGTFVERPKIKKGVKKQRGTVHSFLFLQLYIITKMFSSKKKDSLKKRYLQGSNL